MIVEVNKVLQKSKGNPDTLEQINVIVEGIDKQDKHMLSNFVYSVRNFASVKQHISGTTTNYSEATQGNREIYYTGTTGENLDTPILTAPCSNFGQHPRQGIRSSFALPCNISVGCVSKFCPEGEGFPKGRD